MCVGDRHTTSQQHSNMTKHSYSVMSGPMQVLFLTVIFVPLQSIELLIVSSGIFYSMSMLPLVYSFTQHSGSNWLKENLGFFLSFVSIPSSILLLSDIFSQTPQLHLNHTHLLSSQLSIPNRLTGLWQTMLVDLLGAQGSSGACLTCIFLERHLALSHVSQVSSVAHNTC